MKEDTAEPFVPAREFNLKAYATITWHNDPASPGLESRLTNHRSQAARTATLPIAPPGQADIEVKMLEIFHSFRSIFKLLTWVISLFYRITTKMLVLQTTVCVSNAVLHYICVKQNFYAFKIMWYLGITFPVKSFHTFDLLNMLTN